MKRTFSFLVALFCFVCFGTFSVNAAEIDNGEATEEIKYGSSCVAYDLYGNAQLLYAFEEHALDFEPISFNSYASDDSLPPAPHLVGYHVEEIEQIIYDCQIPGGASFVFLDYGPNWQNYDPSANGGNVAISGRYQYVFYGRYSTEHKRPCTGGYNYDTGHACYSFTTGSTPDSNVLRINGPYAMVSYNPDDNQIYQQVNVYDNSFVTGGSYYLEFTGIVSLNDTANSSYYPKVVTFADVDLSYFDLGAHDLTLDMDSFAWNISWDGTIKHPENENTNSFWDDLLDGNYSSSDNPIVNYFAQALVKLAQFIEFFKVLPEKFSSFVSFLPPVFVEFLIVCCGILIGAFLVKLAIHVFGLIRG